MPISDSLPVNIVKLTNSDTFFGLCKTLLLVSVVCDLYVFKLNLDDYDEEAFLSTNIQFSQNQNVTGIHSYPL